MSVFNIFWQMCSDERSYNDKNRCCFWTYELNPEWKIKCACETNKLRNLSFMEIHRKSSAAECIISGLLEIYDEPKSQCLLKKKFICLLENNIPFATIDLQHPSQTVKLCAKSFLITGKLTISVRTDSSMELCELVHMTSSDYASLKHLSNDMELLLADESLLGDIIVKCESVSIPAHKSILSARSPVFKAMFAHPMKEFMENEVVIKGFQVSVLQTMLKYMYTGRIENLTPVLACELLLAANKYQIECLEATCNKYLMHQMSMKNVASILLLGDFVSPQMKNFAIDFVCNKCTDYAALEKTNDWITLKNEKPLLALEIFSCVVKSQEKKLKMLA